MIQFSTYI